MPELPEVETIRLGLEKYLVGHKIKDVEIRVSKLFEGDPKKVIGTRVTGVRRFGKGLVIDLSNKYSLAIHIKLTGQLVYRDGKTKSLKVSPKVGDSIPNKFTHVIFKLDPPSPRLRRAGKNAFLYYNDRRRFGWIRVVKTDQVSEMPFFKNLGPEPFKDLTLKLFVKILSRSGTAIKPLLMDQKRIGGIGNIYANDALNLAKISPKRSGKSLSLPEVKSLFDAILKVMEKGFKYGGASELNFVNVLGLEGEYQNHSRVYGKKGEKCPNCHSTLRDKPSGSDSKSGGIIQKIFL